MKILSSKDTNLHDVKFDNILLKFDLINCLSFKDKKFFF